MHNSELSESWNSAGILDDADQRVISSIARRNTYAPGDLVIEQGQRRRQLIFIVSGWVEIVQERDGVSRLINEVGPGQILGELAFVTGRRATATARCADPVETEELGESDMDRLGEQAPGLHARLCLAIAQVAADRLARSMTRRPELVKVLSARAPSWTGTLATIHAIRFSPLVQHYVDRYEAIAHRDAFLWRWATIGVEQTRLVCVDPTLHESIRDTKLLAVILNVLIDDIADRHRSIPRLEAAIACLDGSTPAPDPAAEPELALIHELWQVIATRCAALPRWQQWHELWRFDYRQVVNCMRYAVLLGRHRGLANLAEHGLYPPHNMNMMVFASIDLMASPSFDADEIGLLRELMWSAQNMGQISNMTVTWRRELDDRDFTSRIYVLALDRGLISRAELDSLPLATIAARIDEGDVEQQLLAEWHEHRHKILARADRVRSIDVAPLVAGLEALLGMTLVARERL